MDNRPPPRPPPHGAAGAKSSHLPPGNYDIFVIPPHSAGSGFLYLPSMQPHRNSFLAGVASTLVVVGIWATVIPAMKNWASTLAASGGMGVFMLIIAVGVLGWAYGKTQVENTASSSGGARPGVPPFGDAGARSGVPPFGDSGAKPSWQRATPASGPSTGWEKAREETRKREEQKRKQDESEKEKARVREREAREKAAREKVAQDRQRRENEAKANKEKEPAKAAANAAGESPKNYKKPTAQSAGDDDEYSYRPYDAPKQHKQNDSTSSFVSGSTWAPSQSTARTTPPPSKRGPYSNKDPDKISIRAVYAFNDLVTKPVAQLVAGVGSVTDGLILKMTTEGLFIDDDVRGVGQREWDIKAWTLKLVEVCCPQFASRAGPSALPARYSAKAKDPVHRFFAGSSSGGNASTLLQGEELDRVLADLMRTCKGHCGSNSSSSSQSGDLKGKHILKASIRDSDNKKYYFVIDAAESWKVAVGLQRLRRGSQVRSLGVSGLPPSETRGILISLGWLRE